ncbi:MAG: hypothetical protein DBX59_07030 [Bacillota bacterium]|nr:MAG: hypothetical protein DBX59_07030 [Bacillota bacterium]
MHTERSCGDVVKCFRGRDEGYFAVMRTDGKFCYLADGARRKTEAPKKKNVKHVEYVGRLPQEVAARIANGGKVGNARLKRLLGEYQ